MNLPTSRIITADVINGLKNLESKSIQCVVTSPPYWGLRDYEVEGQLGLEKTQRPLDAGLRDMDAQKCPADRLE